MYREDCTKCQPVHFLYPTTCAKGFVTCILVLKTLKIYYISFTIKN